MLKQHFCSSLDRTQLIERCSSLPFLTIPVAGRDIDFFCDRVDEDRFRFYSYQNPNTRPQIRAEFYLHIADNQITLTTSMNELGRVLCYMFTLIPALVILICIYKVAFTDSVTIESVLGLITGAFIIAVICWFVIILSIALEGNAFEGRLSKELSLKSIEVS